MATINKSRLKSFLGTGWSFPPAFNPLDHTVELVSEAADIRQSLHLLFSTLPGERIMKPEYGCDLQSMVFERLTASTEGQIIDLITTAVLRFEPRIILDEVIVTMDDALEGRINITVLYTIRITNSRDNIVYPFYFNEGTNIRNM
ncbi:MAG: GPW/gp25 family protein [Bacteroidota bacterium]